MKRYVDLEHGLISRDIFVDEAIYKAEQENIFCRSWLFIGHASQVAAPGDYFASRMGEESVVMVRDREGGINVLLNSCRHRGMKVCRYDEGNTRALVCPYHGWSYDLKGALTGVPRLKDAYFEEFKREDFGLLKARSVNWHGMIWATWDFKGQSFEEYLGGMEPFLRGLLLASDGSEDEMEMLPGVQKWLAPCNWKFPAENSAGDVYHAASHSSVEMIGVGPGGKGQTRHGIPWKLRHLTSFPALGHAFRGSPDTVMEEYFFPKFKDPTVDAYYRQAYERLKASGATKPAWLWGGGGNMFPNMNFHSRFPRTIMVAHPAGPTRTEMWRWFFVEKSMPREVKEYLRTYLMRYSGPGGMVEQDDMENWNYATSASVGVMARKLPYNLQQGLGRFTDSDDPYPGARYSTGAISECNALSLYGRWAELMEAGQQRGFEAGAAPASHLKSHHDG
jgi:nitrite reductase/ring-hydroxylating ferredoxin subunit